jgi:hypothetical protein
VQLDQAAIVIRPRTLAAVADLAFRYVFALQPRLYLKLCATLLLPPLLILGYLRHMLSFEWFGLWVMAIAYTTFAQGAFTVAAGRMMFERDVTFKNVMQGYGTRFWGHFFPILFTRLAVAATLITFALGMVYWIRYAFVHEAVLLEGQKGKAGPERSAGIVRGHTSDAFKLLLLLWATQLGFVFCAEALGRALLEYVLMFPTLTEPVEEAGGSLFALFGFLVATPFVTATRFLAYIDARTRRDGWDIQVAFLDFDASVKTGVR